MMTSLRLNGLSLLVTMVAISTSWAHSLSAPGAERLNNSTASQQSTHNAEEPVTLQVKENQPFASWAPSFNTVNNVQVAAPQCGGSESTTAHLVNLTETILALLESQEKQPLSPQPQVDHPRDCYDILVGGNDVSGQYAIYPDGAGDPFFVYCDMDTDGGGWTVFQRRENGAVEFYRDWCSYKNGFGSVSSEHWLGNDKIHRVSTQKAYQLRIDLEDFDGETRHANYSLFLIADESSKYALTVTGYSGDAGDSLGEVSGSDFSTKDQDNDDYYTSCAVTFEGAWWYSSCHKSHLNGLYLIGTTTIRAKGVVWYTWHGHFYSLKKTEMKIRPVS